MKIAQFCPYDLHRPGGVQRHICDLAVALQELGHEVAIIAAQPVGVSGDDFAGTRTGDCEIVHVGHAQRISFSKTSFEITIALGEQRKKLRDLMDTACFDVVHFHTMLSPFMPMQAFLRSRAANVATFHDVPPHTTLGGALRFIYASVNRWLLPRLDGVILSSEVHGAYQPLERAPLAKVIPSYPDLREFRAKHEPFGAFRDDRVNLLFLGRLETRKGAIILLQAYRELCRQGLPVRLLIVGEGSERNKLERFVKDNVLPDVTFVGAVKNADLGRWYATCDVFCAPSLYGEGLGLVLAEAMASGKPVVAAANEGYSTVLIDDGARFLTPPGDALALAGALRAMVTDPLLRERFGRWGRAQSLHYDIRQFVPQVVEIYEQAVAGALRRRNFAA